MFFHYLEAGAGATVLPALGVQGEQLAWEDPGQRLLLVGRVVHTRGRLPAEKRNISSSHDDDLTSSFSLSTRGCPKNVLLAYIRRENSVF